MPRVRIRRSPLVLLVLPLVVAVYYWYVRPIREARLIGVDWSAVVSHSNCQAHTTEVDCSVAVLGPPAPHESSIGAIVQFNPWTRGTTHVSRAWMVADSARWSALTDSIRRRLDDGSGEPLSCVVPDGDRASPEAWAFGRYEARLYTGRESATTNHGVIWDAAIELVPRGTPGCGRVFRYRVPSPGELGRQIQDWLFGE